MCSHCTTGADVWYLKLLRCLRFLESAKGLSPRAGWIPAVEMQADTFGTKSLTRVDWMKLQVCCINRINTQQQTSLFVYRSFTQALQSRDAMHASERSAVVLKAAVCMRPTLVVDVNRYVAVATCWARGPVKAASEVQKSRS